MKIKVAIVEDEADLRKMTASLLNFYPDLECVGAFEDAQHFEAILPVLLPAVVLMDIGLPKKNGIECVRTCKSEFPQVEFIMFTTHSDTKEIFEALAAGASGYVLKGCAPELLANAIREAMEGGSPMSRKISRMVTESFRKTEKIYPELETLTPQEWEVLKLLDKGWSYKEIADNRFVSENTVRSQVRMIYQKLQVHTRTDALNKLHGRG